MISNNKILRKYDKNNNAMVQYLPLEQIDTEEQDGQQRADQIIYNHTPHSHHPQKNKI